MSGWSELGYLGVTVRPLGAESVPLGGRWSSFRAPWNATVSLLAKELRQLDARQIVLQIAVTERDVRIDGMPRANARLLNPAVILSFESKYGPLRYATGEYDDWQDNVRAVALSMQALRAVDRYGVSKRGEQYTGWRAIPQSTDPADSLRTREQAQEFLDGEYGGDLRRALFETHPDRGGDSDEFRRVVRAKELLAG
jgi:hypothetical protein